MEYKDLIDAISSLGDPNWLDYVQMITTCISIIISAIAVVMAVKVPKRIAEEQKKIDLFDKRFDAYSSFQKYEAFAIMLEGTNDVDDYKKFFVHIFYGNNSQGYSSVDAVFEVCQVSQAIHKMLFLFNGITDIELEEMMSSLLDFIISLDNNINVEKRKIAYIDIIEKFRQKHIVEICRLLEIES